MSYKKKKVINNIIFAFFRKYFKSVVHVTCYSKKKKDIAFETNTTHFGRWGLPKRAKFVLSRCTVMIFWGINSVLTPMQYRNALQET